MPTTTTLAQRLKSETRDAHTAAERSPFIARLLKGRLERGAYCGLLSNLAVVYAALEPALQRHARHAVIAPVFLPSLWRQQALADDLRHLHGTHWAEEIAVSPAAAAYADHLAALDAMQPERLLAHAYVRYLGDLSGGQVLRRIVAQSLSLHDGAGTAFYDFGDAAATRTLTLALRDGLDRVPADAATADALVAEALLAFRLHQRLFEDLALAYGVGLGDEAGRARRA